MGWFDDNGYMATGEDGAPQYTPQVLPPGDVTANTLPPGGGLTFNDQPFGQPSAMPPGVAPPPGRSMWSPGTVAGAPAQDITGLYQKYYGSAPDPTTMYYAQGNPGGLPALEAMMKADPNAQAYLKSQQPAQPPGAQPPVSGAKLQSNNLTAPGLMDLLGHSPLMAPWTQPLPSGMTTPFEQGPQFKAPTLDEVKQTPGYQFTLQQGIDALQKSAAAKGTLLTGGMMKSLQEFGSGLADSTYQQQFNNAYQTWAGNNASRYQTWAGNQTQAAQNYGTEYNIYRGNQVQPFDMLSALSNGGQAAAQNLNSASMGVGANAGNTMMGIGNAQAAGTVGGANAANSAIGNAGNSAMLWALMNKSSYGGGSGGPSPMNPYADFA